MVVDDFDLVRILILPNEANPPLSVDADRMLSCPITRQGFEAVAGRDAQIVQPVGIIEKTKLP